MHLSIIISRRNCGLRGFRRFQSTNSRTRWFYATDIPKRKPEYLHYTPEKSAEKYVPFSAEESSRIEKVFESGKQNQVSVKEDGLFQCLLKEREMSPVYWDGPTYDIRRGTWFYDQPGKKLYPVDEAMAEEIESLYASSERRENGKSKEGVSHNLKKFSAKVRFSTDPGVAFIKSEELLQKITSLGDVKLVKGYYEEKKEEQAKTEKGESEKSRTESDNSAIEAKFKNLFSVSKAHQEKRLEHQMEHDYNTNLLNQADCGRDVDHLVLCVHGIGQKLATKIESVNFVHDINMLRSKMKEIYAQSEDLQTALHPNVDLTKEQDKSYTENSRVQVLPVLWRHNIQFGMTESDRKNEDDVTLEDVNVDGVTVLRNIVGDVILDVLLYKQDHYKREILSTVTKKLNTIIKEFSQRNERFAQNPKISLVGHSLGSAICFDILANQKEYPLGLPVTDYFALGSPLGLFELINNRKMDANTLALEGSFYNVFHPCDPVAYRVEPLVDRKAALVMPEKVPYTRGGLTSQIQELSDLGSKISTSATTVWNNFTSSFSSKTEFVVQDLFRKTARDIMDEEEQERGPKPDLEEEVQEDDDARTRQKKREIKEIKGDIKQKLAQLNATERIDYALQEGVLDISIIAALASHMSYFENEDVAHFLLNRLYHDH